MTLPLETVRPSQLRLLVLVPDYVDFLWLTALLSRDSELVPDATWCPDLIDCDDLIHNASFDVIVWDCVFHSGSESAFLQYLAVASNEKPILALSAETERARAPDLLAAGADASARNKEGQIAADWARRRGMDGVAALLEGAAARATRDDAAPV